MAKQYKGVATPDDVSDNVVKTPEGKLTRDVARARGYRLSDEAAEPNGQMAILDGNGCILPDGTRATAYKALYEGYEVVTPRAMAIRLGYIGAARDTITDDIKRNLASATVVQRNLAFVAAVMSLPEAKSRPITAAKIAAAYAGTWAIEKAAAFLSGLPTEKSEDGTNPATSSTPAINERKLRRTVELRIAALAHNQAAGSRQHCDELRSLRYALSIVERTGAVLSEALAYCDIDPHTYVLR